MSELSIHVLETCNTKNNRDTRLMRHAWDRRSVLISTAQPSTSALGMAVVGFFS